MTATITELPRRRLRPLATIDVLIKAQEVALALGGTGVQQKGPVERPYENYYRCRCPLCDGPMRIADNIEGIGTNIDCQHGCSPEEIAFALIKHGLFTCQDARRVG